MDINRPGSQENLVSNWEPAHSLGEDAVSGAEFDCMDWSMPGLVVHHLLSIPEFTQTHIH